MVKHLLVFRTVEHLDRRLGNPLVHIVVQRGDVEGVFRVVLNGFDQAGLHEFFQRAWARVVDGFRVVGAVKQVKHDAGVRLLEHLRQVVVQRAIDAVPPDHVVGEVRGVGVRFKFEGLRELRTADVVGPASRNRAREGEFIAVGGGCQVLGQSHRRVAALGVAGNEVLAIQGVSQFLGQRIGRAHQVESRIGFGVGVDIGVHQLACAQSDVVRHQHELSQGGHESAKGPFHAEERRGIRALENGAVHVDVDGKSARVFHPLRHEQRTAHLDGVPEEWHVVQDAVGVHVKLRGKGVARNSKHGRCGCQLALGVRGQQFCGLAQAGAGEAQPKAGGEEDARRFHGRVLDQGKGLNANKARHMACLVAICAWRSAG